MRGFTRLVLLNMGSLGVITTAFSIEEQPAFVIRNTSHRFSAVVFMAAVRFVSFPHSMFDCTLGPLRRR